jgi:hypothetical protein
MTKSGRGVLYMVWGDEIEATLQRSLASVKRHHPELPIEVMRLKVDPNAPESLLQKANMFDRSPFAESVYLDADTIVLDRLDFAFERARRFGLACAICEYPWARRYRGLADRGDLIEYNTGVLFFAEAARSVFETWRDLASEVDSSAIFAKDGKPAVMPFNDQASFAAAIERASFSPFVLPHNWNFRYPIQRSFVGPIKIWHSYWPVPADLERVSEYYRNPDAMIQPVELNSPQRP